MTLNTADAVYVGDVAADRVYLGDLLVWESTPTSYLPPEWMLNPADPYQGSNSGEHTLGLRFTATAPGIITHLRYHHLATCPAPDHALTVWNDAGAKLAAVSDPAPSGYTGWREVALPQPLTVAAGQRLTVSYAVNNGARYSYRWTTPVSLAPHLVIDSAVWAYGYDLVPTLTSAEQYMADVTFRAEGSVPWAPDSIAGLVTWLDAADYTPGSWPNKSTGPTPTIVSSPAMVNGAPQNGLPTVRFKINEGRLRSTFPHPVHDYTLVYLVRWVGPNAGRAFSVQYPPSNITIGMHTTSADTMYDNGTWLGGYGWNGWNPPPGPWRMYEADCQQGAASRFFVDGEFKGSPAAIDGGGLTGGWGLSGYESTGPGETMDIEVAELVLYNRKLPDAERKQVEDYLYDRWFVTHWDPDTQAYLTATGLNVSYAPALDGLVRGLKDAGLWSKMVAIYPFIGGTEALHKWNLKDPRDADDAYRLTFRAGTHSPALGYQPNPVAIDANGQGRADTHLVPLGLLAQNSTHLSMYSLQSKDVYQRCDMGAYNWDGALSRFHVIAHYLGERFYYGMAESGASSAPSPASTGLFVATRTGANEQSAYRNGVSVGTSSSPSVSLPSIALHIGEISGYDREYSDLPVGFASIGAGLSATDVASLNLVVTDYQIALGRRPAFTGFW